MNAPLRPLSTGELLDTTFSLYRRHFVLFAGLVALPYLCVLPLQLLNVFLQPAGAGLGSQVLLTLLVWVVALAANSASQGATVMAVSRVYLGRPATVTGSLSLIRGNIVAICVLTIAMFTGVAIGVLLLVVPGVILALMWSMAVPAMVLEDLTIGESFSRSAELTKGYRGRILLIYVLFIIIVTIVSVLINLPVGIATAIAAMRAPGSAPPGSLLMVGVATSFVTQCLVGPLMTIGISVLYYDVRVRKEAFDLQLMMNAQDGTQAGA